MHISSQVYVAIVVYLWKGHTYVFFMFNTCYFMNGMVCNKWNIRMQPKFNNTELV